MIHGGWLAVDWGTTNVRAWRLTARGEVEDRAEFPLGVGRLAAGEAAARFQTVIRPRLEAQSLPALLCGMIGSTLGWALAPYVDCPASPDRLAAALIEVSPGVRIVPGLRCAGLAGPDVMRGEETQILGWLAAEPARRLGRRLLCLPGTHAKWVAVRDGVVERFVTAMTGELHSVLGAHSVLKFSPGPHDADAFDRGVAAAGEGDALSARLFNARGLTLSGELAPASMASFVSGLLIGSEIASLQPRLAGDSGQSVDLIGDAGLCELYARAMSARGVASTLHDGDGCVLGGLKRIWAAAA